MTKPRHPWTPEADARLAELHKSGMIARDIAIELGRSPAAIWVRAHVIGITLKRDKPPETVLAKVRHTRRQCMHCCKPFVSDGPHHRMCSVCRHLSAGVEPYPIYD